MPIEGSPPLARERPDPAADRIPEPGITPARAGKTCAQFFPDSFFQDHPRSRGKDPPSRIGQTSEPGSPPLARERLYDLRDRDCLPGITPARAGKTWRIRIQMRVVQDHPRSRGKDIVSTSCFAVSAGSPPLARERLIATILANNATRITPARAGKTLPDMPPATRRWDHPRSRGKDTRRERSGWPSGGSPPLARERLDRV